MATSHFTAFAPAAFQNDAFQIYENNGYATVSVEQIMDACVESGSAVTPTAYAAVSVIEVRSACNCTAANQTTNFVYGVGLVVESSGCQ